jgi:hypothetical protein
MIFKPRIPPVAAAIALLAFATAPWATWADTPATNDGMRYVSVGAQADSQHNQEALATVSLPVGQQAWVQAGVGKSRSDQLAGGYRPGILTGAAGVAGQAWQLTLNASRRADASRYQQTDWGSSLDWRHGGGNVGLDVTHRRLEASGTVAGTNAQGGSAAVPAQVRLSGTGLGVHGNLPVSEHVSVYGSVARNHYKSTTRQTDPTAPPGLLGSNPLLTNTLPGGSSVVNLDQVALSHSAQAGATYRWSRVAVSGEYTVGQVYGSAAALRSVAVKSAIDVAPGWRVASGLGGGTSDQGGHANFASLSATYGW